VRRPFEGHRAAGPGVGRFDLGLAEAEARQHVEADVVELCGREAQHPGAELFAERPLVEGELDVEGGAETLLDRLDLRLAETLGLEGLMADGGRAGERAAADRVRDDLVDLGLAVAEGLERLRHHAVDDLEVAAAGELLELDQREIGLDAGGVAIHHQADRAGRGDDRRLRVAIAVRGAELERLVPRRARMRHEVGDRAFLRGQRHGVDGEALVAGALAVRGAAMVADHPQHVLAVLGVAGEGAELLRHLRRGRIGDAGHHRGDRRAQRAPGRRIVRQAHGHQQAADIGEAEAEGAEVVGQLRDLARGELRHHHRDLERHRPQPAGVLEGLDVK
jgi:hypothetical protein